MNELLQILQLAGPYERYELKSIKTDLDGEIEEGYLICKDTNTWHRIENYILDLRPVILQDREKTIEFARRNNLPLPEANNGNNVNNGSSVAQKQIDFFKDDSKVYDKTVTNLPYYKIFDSIYQQKWIDRLASNSFVLDIGGGTGRQSVPIALKGNRVVLTDISEEMLVVAVKKAKEDKVKPLIKMILCDATNLPFKSGLFDAVICYGSLHHMPDAGLVIKEGGRVCKDNGRWFSIDPNASSVRFIFDWFMRMKKLYDEVAADDIHLDKKVLVSMLIDAKFEPKISYSTYLLPHIMGILPFKFGRFMLKATDITFSHIPWLNSLGGVILAYGEKNK